MIFKKYFLFQQSEPLSSNLYSKRITVLYLGPILPSHYFYSTKYSLQMYRLSVMTTAVRYDRADIVSAANQSG